MGSDDATATTPELDPPTAADGLPWQDLADNLPGHQVQLQATALARQAPVRTLVSRLLGVTTEERVRRSGAKGERLVARELARLPRGWHVLHGLPVGPHGTDIDHLLVSPAGVFTLDAKRHPDAKLRLDGNRLQVNGVRVNHLQDARSQAALAGRALSAALGEPVTAHGMVVVVDGELLVGTQPPDVSVVVRRDVATWLRRRRQALTPDQVARIFEVARRSTTWVPQL